MLSAAEARPDEPDEAFLRARAGDSAGFAELVQQHQTMVYSLAIHVVRDHAVAEDVAQDVFLELHQSIGRIESSTHLVFWLRRVTSHRCIDRARRLSHRPESAMDVVPDRPVLPDSRDVLLEERLREVVRELPIHPRLVVTLRFQEDLQPSEIAAVLGMPVNTVKSHLRRSLAVLRGRFQKRGLHV